MGTKGPIVHKHQNHYPHHYPLSWGDGLPHFGAPCPIAPPSPRPRPRPPSASGQQLVGRGGGGGCWRPELRSQSLRAMSLTCASRLHWHDKIRCLQRQGEVLLYGQAMILTSHGPVAMHCGHMRCNPRLLALGKDSNLLPRKICGAIHVSEYST